MSKRSLGTSILAVAAIVAACGEAASNHSAEVVVDTLANGAVHVLSPESGIWREGEGWRLVEEVRIGTMDGTGPDVFGSIAGLEADSEGRIYVADGQASELRIFGPDGRHLRTLGREGSGPGEFRQMSGIDWHPDGRLWVNDPQNARFSVFDPEQGFVESHRREIAFRMFPWPGRLDRHGDLYEVALADGEGSPAHRQRLIVRHAPPDFDPVDTLALPVHRSATFELTLPDGRGMTSAGIPFTPSQLWSIAPDGDLWIGTNDRYRIHRVARSGDTIRVLERPYRPVAVTAAERQEVIDNMEWFTSQGGRIDASRIPDTKPAFGRLFEDEAGYLWVTATVAEGESRSFDVFDPDGRYLGAVEAPEGLGYQLPVIRGSHLYAVVQDDFEVPYVARYRIEGRGVR